jgi:hypothetical protein
MTLKDPALISYWITPSERTMVPFGIGVTAYSVEDAWSLVVATGWRVDRAKAKIVAGIRFEDLDAGHVVPNMGPMIFRGVWHPCHNIGFGASGA